MRSYVCRRVCADVAASTESYLMHRVDAARKLMSVPGRGMEATGRLFVAKRCHEAAKGGRDVVAALDEILAEVVESLSEAAHEGAREEAGVVRARLS